MTLSEKVAYLKGLAEGSGIAESSNEGKVLSLIIDIVEEVSRTVTDVEDKVEEMGLQVDEIDDDLAAIEDEWYGEDEFEEDENEDECCCCHHHDDEEEYDDEYDDEEVEYEVECPVCGDKVIIDDEMLDEGYINCPSCGEKLEFDFEETDCCCGGCDGNCSDEE